MLDGVLKDLLDGQVLVLGNVQRFHFVCGNVCLLPSQDVLQEVDGDVVVRRQVDFTFAGQEVVAFPKRTSSVRATEAGTYLLDLNLLANCFADTC